MRAEPQVGPRSELVHPERAASPGDGIRVATTVSPRHDARGGGRSSPDSTTTTTTACCSTLRVVRVRRRLLPPSPCCKKRAAVIIATYTAAILRFHVAVGYRCRRCDGLLLLRHEVRVQLLLELHLLLQLEDLGLGGGQLKRHTTSKGCGETSKG